MASLPPFSNSAPNNCLWQLTTFAILVHPHSTVTTLNWVITTNVYVSGTMTYVEGGLLGFNPSTSHAYISRHSIRLLCSRCSCRVVVVVGELSMPCKLHRDIHTVTSAREHDQPLPQVGHFYRKRRTKKLLWYYTIKPLQLVMNIALIRQVMCIKWSSRKDYQISSLYPISRIQVS